MSAWLRSVTNQHRGPFLEQVLRTAPMIAAVIIFTTALKSSGWLDVIETTGLDAMSREVAAHQPARARRFEHVTIVGIGDAEYKNMFHDTSPLNADLLFATIENIESLHPAAIGVDVATASDVYADKRFRAGGTAPIVWATAGRHATAGVDRLMPVLYGHRDLLRPMDAVGDAEFPSLNVDGVLRNYVVSSPLARAGPGIPARLPSFATALATKFCAANENDSCRLSESSKDESDDNAPEDDPLIDYSGECYSPPSSSACVGGESPGEHGGGPLPYMNFRTLDEHAKLQRTLCPQAKPVCPGGDPIFKGQVVLLGGFFTDGGDVHPTPFGLREGVEIWARAIDTEIDGTGRMPVREGVLLAIDIIVALLLTSVGWYFRFLPGLAIAVAVPILLLGVSFAFFGVFGAWLDVIPMSVGVILHNLGEHGTEYVKLRRAEEAREDTSERESERADNVEAKTPVGVAAAADVLPRSASIVPPEATSENAAPVATAATPSSEAATPAATPAPEVAPEKTADSIR